jgi:hypothetical protein
MAQWSTTYPALLSLLTDYVEDNSTEFSSAVQGCINRAEERILRDIDLAIWNETTSASTSNGVGSFAKGFSGTHAQHIFFTASGEHAQRRSLEFIQAYGGSGRPEYFYEDADRIYWAPTPDNSYAYSVTAYARPDPLSPSNTSNWIALNLGDLLLWGALIECEAFLIAPERVQEFEAKYQQMLGPARAFWRQQMQLAYEPVNPTPTPVQTR